MSGDDDLFINEVARANNTTVVADPRSFMTTRATPDLITWMRRKRRHYTTAAHYRFGHQVLLTLLPWRASCSGHVPGALRWGNGAKVAIGLAVKLCVFLPITHARHAPPGRGALIWLRLPLEWLFLLLDPLLYVSTLLIKPRRWK
jgi:hypothetical protein